MSVSVQFLSGVLACGYAAAALFFLRFWRQSADRLFLYFCAAFSLLALQRVLLLPMPGIEAWYLLRLLAFVIILAGIIDKNRAQSRSKSE